MLPLRRGSSRSGGARRLASIARFGAPFTVVASLAIVTLLALAPAPARADDAAHEEKGWTVRGQATYIGQWKPGFSAAYSGPNSLRADRERSYSITGTLYLGTRLWRGAELYLNPETAMGVPLSSLTGLGGFSNGELARVSSRDPTFYRARFFLRQTFGFGGGTDRVDEDDNQIATRYDRNRLVVTAGNFSALDLHDDNAYAKDPRTQFMNWSLFAPGAWDYPADARGYTWGIAAEWITPAWTLRAGRFAMPRESNGLELNPRVFHSYGDAVEVERRYALGEREGRVNFLVFRNRAWMASFRESLAQAEASGQPPSLDTSRADRVKTGFALGFNQAVADGVGVFGRYSWSDGQTETFAFTEIDRSASVGVSVDGRRWARAADTLGLAFVRNAISTARKDYLAAGGISFFIGDGRLTYAGERIVETYYRIALTRLAALSLDWQHVANPAYNADRGPVNVYSARIHVTF